MKRIEKPELMVNEAGKRVHPLLLLNERIGPSRMMELLGHKNHSTASIYVSRARARPTTRIPAEWSFRWRGSWKYAPIRYARTCTCPTGL